MATLTYHECHELARTVAKEIDLAARAYGGRRWETVDGREKAVPFEVAAASLQGLRYSDVGDSFHPFSDKVYLAESHTYRDGAGYTRSARVLHGYHFDLEVENGVYTGTATVRERSFDYDL